MPHDKSCILFVHLVVARDGSAEQRKGNWRIKTAIVLSSQGFSKIWNHNYFRLDVLCCARFECLNDRYGFFFLQLNKVKSAQLTAWWTESVWKTSDVIIVLLVVTHGNCRALYHWWNSLCVVGVPWSQAHSSQRHLHALHQWTLGRSERLIACDLSDLGTQHEPLRSSLAICNKRSSLWRPGWSGTACLPCSLS